ncbi:hypothetical protein MMC11_003860 [Xylographa trunciseda]|nr:hypothetical protein [Xylographa trunciseda]
MPAILPAGMSAAGFQPLVELIQAEQVSVEEFEQSLHEFDVGKLSSNVRVSTAPSLTVRNSIESVERVPDAAAGASDQFDMHAIIKALYPSTNVTSAHVLAIANSLGQGKQKPSPATQNLLLRWIIMVHEALDEPTILTKLYNVFFNRLDMISIRCPVSFIVDNNKQKACEALSHPNAAHLASDSLELSSNFVSEPALTGLLKVYKEYYPDVIVGQSADAKSARFEHPDQEWRDRLRIIQNTNARATDTFANTTSFKVVRRATKRTQTAIVPEVHTFFSDESSTTLEDINGVEDFIEKLDTIGLPNQLVSVLEDPLLRHYVMLKPNYTTHRRIDDWLSMFLDTQTSFKQPNSDMSSDLTEVLKKVLNYLHYTRHMPKSVLSFLLAFLPQWDGKGNRDTILSLLAYLPIDSFEELQQSILMKIEFAVLDNTVESAAALLEYYTSVVRHWTIILLSLPDPHTPDMEQMIQSFAALVDRSSLLSLSLLASFTPTQSTISTVLCYHETLAHTISHAATHAQIRIITPYAETVYLLIFLNPALSTLSRLCSVLATYKRTFEAAMSKPPSGSTYEYPRGHVNRFNGFLMDICNLLWRSRAFNTSDTNALGCLLSAQIPLPIAAYLDMLTPPYALQTVFSLSHNSSLSALSTAAFRDLEENATMNARVVRTRHIGPVTQRSLEALAMDGGVKISWPDYRLEVLRWLSDRGVGGIGDLMSCTMKQLMGIKMTGAGSKLTS